MIHKVLSDLEGDGTSKKFDNLYYLASIEPPSFK